MRAGAGITLILAIFLAFALWEIVSLHREVDEAEAYAQSREAYALELEKRVLALENEVKRLTLIQQQGPGKKMLDAWDSLRNNFDKQMDKTREKIYRELYGDSESESSDNEEIN